MDDEAIFAEALGLEGIARTTFLARECQGKEQRARIESLIAHAEAPDSFLSKAPMTMESTGTFDSEDGRASDRTVGPYQLREQIGEGGMGVVYVAEQSKPVRRKVALKVIKPGMDSKEVVARFEAERQALAMMDHPSIAKVFDGGVTDNGRPYFAMELINGVPITNYCDDQKLAIRQRLELFVQVCKAIGHAHQKGVIHRDVKPSNVLVTLHDGNPVPVVIDFGIAKATNQSLTEQTIYTRLNQVVGTTLYMSPEQAELSRYGVDTRTDIYSLGVLLYELLTGTTPFDSERLSRAGFDEIRRIIREEEPPKPSTRVSGLGETATDISSYRGTDPSKLTHSIRGDLDWIVMKSLEKDRNRRYESASRFADDIENFLNDQIVEARPPSLAYQTQKLWRRNRVLLSTASGVVALLTCGLALALWGIQQRNQTLEKLHQVAITQGVQQALIGEDVEETIILAVDAGVSVDWIETILGAQALHRGENKSSREHFERAIAEEEKNIAAKCMLSIALFHDGQFVEHEELMRSFDTWKPREQFQELDTLFLAYAQIYHNREKAADELRLVLEKHPSWISARAMLAGALGEAAISKQDPELASAAVSESSVPATVATDNPFFLMVDLFTHIVACEISPDAKLIDEGRDISKSLASHPNYRLGTATRLMFEDRFGDKRQTIALGRQLANTHGYFATSAVAALLRCGEEDFVVNLDPTEPSAIMARAILLTQLPNHHDDVIDLVHKWIKENTAQTLHDRQQFLILLLLSRENELARGECEKWLADMDWDSTSRPVARLKPILEFVARVQTLDAPGIDPITKNRLRLFQALEAYSKHDDESAIRFLEQFNNTADLSPWSYWGEALLPRWQASHKKLLQELPAGGP